MREAKTKPTDVHPQDFIAAVQNPVRRADALELLQMMERVTGEPATMWGPSIIGFGRYHYIYASGNQGEMCRIGFSPRAANLVLYIGAFPAFETLAGQLGKYRLGKACLYLNKLADVDMAVLEEIVRRSFDATHDIDMRAGG